MDPVYIFRRSIDLVNRGFYRSTSHRNTSFLLTEEKSLISPSHCNSLQDNARFFRRVYDKLNATSPSEAKSRLAHGIRTRLQRNKAAKYTFSYFRSEFHFREETSTVKRETPSLSTFTSVFQ